MSKYNLDFQDVELIYRNKKVVFEWIGEGNDGDYNEDDEDDIPLLRFSCDERKYYDRGDERLEDDGVWEGMEDASYCTQMPINTPMKVLIRGMALVMEAIQDINYKRRLEELSWMKPEDFMVKV